MANFIPQIKYPASTGATTITLTLPAANDPYGEKREMVGREVRSTNGSTQFAKDYEEQTLKVKLSFITETEATALRTWFDGSAGLKVAFQYFVSSDEAKTGDFILDQNTLDLKRIAPAGSGNFLYETELNLRRVL